MDTLLPLLVLTLLGGGLVLFLRARREDDRHIPQRGHYRSCAPEFVPEFVPHFHVDRHPQRPS